MNWHLNAENRASNSVRRDTTNCEPADPNNTLTDRLNTRLNSSGPGYVLQLCPNTQYLIEAPILFAFPQQEISTLGYPTGNERATLVVNGPVTNGSGHTTAVDGTCSNCNGVKLRNIQIDGTRAGAPPTNGGANIEFGGSNSDQLIEYVHSWDPRSWSCLHIAEGALSCNNVTVQNNDIGPAGSDAFQQWADGISVSCKNAVVRNNMVKNPTDGGIVLFGSPGSQVYNNTVWVETQTLLGGINMVDYLPFSGDYTGTVVRNNTIVGGFSTDQPTSGGTDGANVDDVIIKIGIAIGPRTWFNDQYGNNVSTSGTVLDNQFTGAFSYAIAMSSATNFTVENNVLIDNTSFIGSRGPNCTTNEKIPTPAAFVIDPNNVQTSITQSNFQHIPDGDGLTCVLPPDGGDYWPFGGKPKPKTPDSTPGTGNSKARTVALSLGIIGGLVAIAIIAWFVRKWALRRAEINRHFRATRQSAYIRS